MDEGLTPDWLELVEKARPGDPEAQALIAEVRRLRALLTVAKTAFIREQSDADYYRRVVDAMGRHGEATKPIDLDPWKDQ